MRGIHRWQVNSPHKGPVTRKMFPFDDAIMQWQTHEITAVYFVAYRITTTKFHDKMATPLFERKVLLGQKYLMEMSGLRRQLPPYLLSMHYDHVYGGKVPCLNDKFITFLHIWYPKIKKLFGMVLVMSQKEIKQMRQCHQRYTEYILWDYSDGVSIICTSLWSGADQRKYKSSAS